MKDGHEGRRTALLIKRGESTYKVPTDDTMNNKRNY